MIPKLDEYKDKWNIQSDTSIKPGLDAIKSALEQLNNPHHRLNIVHIAGTNGKGSTLSFIENIAMMHGLTIGKFMSPCIVDVHDQIQINGKPISKEEMNTVFSHMEKANISGHLTDFELLTCAAFIYFQKKQVDLVLVEAGMGGRYDSTNVISPIVSVITSISLEHTRFLGNSIESIAYHKAGIIKKDKPVIIGDLPREAIDIILLEATSNEAPLYVLGSQFFVQVSEEGDTYTNKTHHVFVDQLHRKLLGNHQGENMALAITAFIEVANYLNINIQVEKIREGIGRTAVPGRFEEVLENVYFDGAHNPASVEMLVKTIKRHFPDETIRFVVGMLADKDVKSVLSILESVSEEFYFVNFLNPRAMNAEEMMNLSNASKKQVIHDYISFIQQARSLNGKTIVTGSLYLLAEIRQKILNS